MNKIMIGKELKKYTLKNYKEFCNDALIMPPFEDDDQLDEWFENHKVHIIANDCYMELEYDADTINEIEYSLKEIHEAILGDGTATTGNTVGSEYRNATWKDILRFAALHYHYNGLSMKEAIHKCIYHFSKLNFKEIMMEIDKQTLTNDDLKVNLLKLDSKDLWKIFDEDERKQAFKEILCTDIVIEELYDKYGRCADKVVITDCSINPAGDLVGWHYGVDWDKYSEDNQYYINEYIKEMVEIG